MFPLQKNKKIKRIKPINFFIPNVSIVLPEKLDEIKNSMVFHLDIVKKIDKIIRDHEKKTILDELVYTKNQFTHPTKSVVEQRDPINKKIEASLFNFEKNENPSFYKKLTIPDEFKSDFENLNNPSFRFESEFNSIEDVLVLENPENQHVEVVNLHSLALESGGVKKDNVYKNKKFFVVETKLFEKDKNNTKVQQQKNNDTEKASIYYLNSKDVDDNTQSYIPVDFEEKLKKLKEKEKKIIDKQKAEQEKIEEKQNAEKKKIEEKQRLEQEKEDKRLKKLEEKKSKLEERQRLKEEKKALAEKLKREAEEKKLLKKEAKKTTNQDIEPKLSKKDLKKLRKIEEKKAKLEAKQKKKEEKEKLVKSLVEEAEEKKQSKNKIKESKKPDPNEVIATYEPVDVKDEVDDDLVKVLLITDELLGNLPDDIIESFSQSEDFKLYEKVINKYKPK